MNLFGRIAVDRPQARRSTVTAVMVALALSALGSVVYTVALHDSLASGLVTFAMFGSLAAVTAGVLAWELASNRACPRCRTEHRSDVASCSGCGYDLRGRPRYACTEGHQLAYEEGMCDCGRRLLPLPPVPLLRHVVRAVWFALALTLAFLVLGLLLNSGR